MRGLRGPGGITVKPVKVTEKAIQKARERLTLKGLRYTINITRSIRSHTPDTADLAIHVGQKGSDRVCVMSDTLAETVDDELLEELTEQAIAKLEAHQQQMRQACPSCGDPIENH